MKKITLTFLIILLEFIYGCKSTTGGDQAPDKSNSPIADGNYTGGMVGWYINNAGSDQQNLVVPIKINYDHKSDSRMVFSFNNKQYTFTGSFNPKSIAINYPDYVEDPNSCFTGTTSDNVKIIFTKCTWAKTPILGGVTAFTARYKFIGNTESQENEGVLYFSREKIGNSNEPQQQLLNGPYTGLAVDLSNEKHTAQKIKMEIEDNNNAVISLDDAEIKGSISGTFLADKIGNSIFANNSGDCFKPGNNSDTEKIKSLTLSSCTYITNNDPKDKTSRAIVGANIFCAKYTMSIGDTNSKGLLCMDKLAVM